MQLNNNIYTDGTKFYKDIKYLNKNINKIKMEGAFSFLKKYKNYSIIGRDHLGCKKIFWGKNRKKIFFSNNFIDLSEKIKKNKNSIKSCPPGFIQFIDKKGNIIKKMRISRLDDKNCFFNNLDDHSKKVRKKILFYLKGIKKIYGNKIYVCLSGGLDSTIIASLASQIFDEVIAVSCSMVSDQDYKLLMSKNQINFNSKIFSNDFKKAYKISKTLGIKFKPVYFPSSNCIRDLKKIFRACQDWRDYNVHCAILNFQIAKSLKSYKEYNNEPVLTGDFMNEYVADYTSEIINGVEYYPQIKQSNTIKQRFFIKGLDSSDRENGIFNYFNIPIFQPYSFVDLYYKKLPEGYLNKGNIKHELNKKLISNKIYKLISKKKVRAQVGGNNQGILKYMVKNKIFQKNLEKMFCKYFNLSKNFISTFINIGTYRT